MKPQGSMKDNAIPLSTYVSILKHPNLWLTALRTLWSFSHPNWWKKKPFLPLPDQKWLSFRLKTAYGNNTDEINGQDLLAWLQWRKDYPC